MKKATLNSVAKAAGVSKTTASLVLNDKADQVNIAKSTQEHVKMIAKKMDYRPGRFSPGRLNGQTGIIGVAASDFSISQNALWLHHLIEASENKEYTIIPKVVIPENALQKITDLPADGFIFLEENTLPARIKEFASEIPVVCAGFKHKDIPHIIPDYSEQINQLITKLYRHNKKAIGLMGTVKDSEEQKEKISAYKDNYCERFDIPENIEFLTDPDHKQKDIIDTCQRLIDKGANGIIFTNSDLTSEALAIQTIRDFFVRGVVFAGCGSIAGNDYLPEGMFFACEEDIKGMAKEVVETIESPNFIA